MSTGPARGPDAPFAGDPVGMTLLGHDLRAAMSDIIGGLRLIGDGRLDEPTRLQLGRIRAASEVMARLLEEALAEIAGEGPLLAEGPVNLYLARFLADLDVRWRGRAREKGLDFAMEIAGDVPAVLTIDRMALDRVLSNLLSNAIKYAGRGQVGLTVARQADGAVTFAVRDTGPGFSPAALAQLFRFAGRPEDAAQPGQGLGLHIARDMADRLGAGLSVDNPAGGGALVTLRLPQAAIAGTAGLTPDAAPRPLDGLRVLVAEDSPTNQAILGHLLRALGAVAIPAADGAEALDRLAAEPLDLALIDIEMPRLNGVEVIRRLRAAGGPAAALPVLAVTAYVLRANREAIYAAGADGILSKPLAGIDAFAQAIGDVRARAGGAAPRPAPAGPALPAAGADRLPHLLEIAGPEGATELLERLAEDLGRVERGLVAGLRDGDLAALRGHTHVLIALAGAVGADPLHALAQAMNAAAHRRDTPALRRMGAEALPRLDALIHRVAETLSTRGGAP